jgi:hypothetical protein
MNDCLLVKWIWKIFQEPDTLWFRILKAKYLDGCSFFSSKVKGSSQFWQGLHKIKHLFKWGAAFKVGNGGNCRFWEDCWLLNVPLKIAYDDLYKMAREPYVSVADCFDGGEWFVDFKRPLSVSEFGNWNILLNHLQTIPLNDSRDSVRWELDQKGLFNTKSLYRFLSNGGFPNRMAGYIWKCKIPLKIKFFLWQMFSNKLPVGGSLIKRGWKGSGRCILSDELETVDHIFFPLFFSPPVLELSLGDL